MQVDRDFPELVRQHQDAVYSIALRLTGRPTEAEDAAQDVFVRAYRALSSYDEARRRQLKMRPWLTTITINVCRNRARAAGRIPATSPLSVVAEPVEAGRGVSQQAEDAETAAELTGALNHLPDVQRRAIVLHHAGGLTYAEVATALKRPEGTVKADVHRGLRTLRALLEQREQPA